MWRSERLTGPGDKSQVAEAMTGVCRSTDASPAGAETLTTVSGGGLFFGERAKGATVCPGGAFLITEKAD